MIQLDALIRSAEELEPLPASVTRLARLVSREDSDLREVVRVIELDQALTARLLRSANSAMSAAVSPITTVRSAVLRVGTGAVLSLATGAAVQQRLGTRLPAYGLEEGALWKHSLVAALAAEIWTRHARVSPPAESFTAALLHDIGKLVLARFLEPEICQVLAEAIGDGHLNPLAAESEVLGVNHAELGGLIAQHWNLPDTIVAGITHHHEPGSVSESVWSGRADIQLICDTVHLADVTAYVVSGREESDPVPPAPEHSRSSIERLGFRVEQFSDIVARTTEHAAGTLAVYS